MHTHGRWIKFDPRCPACCAEKQVEVAPPPIETREREYADGRLKMARALVDEYEGILLKDIKDRAIRVQVRAARQRVREIKKQRIVGRG